MRCPRTVFSTAFRGGSSAVRARLTALLAGRRRLGIGLIAAALCTVVLAGALVTCRPQAQAPTLDTDVLCPLLEYEGRHPASASVLASGARDGRTVAAVLARYEEPYTLILYPCLIAQGSPVTLEGAQRYCGPLRSASAWAVPDGERLSLYFLADLAQSDGITGTFQGGCLVYEDGQVSWSWPAPAGTAAYQTFWRENRELPYSSEPGAPFLLTAAEHPIALEHLGPSFLTDQLLPALSERGVTALGVQLLPRELGLITLPESTPRPQEVPVLWLLDYRVLPADPAAARAAGFTLDEQGWLVPDASLGWMTAAVNSQGRQVCAIPVSSGDTLEAMEQAQAALDQAQAIPDPSATPVTDSGGTYDADTGIFYSQAIDLGYLVPEPLRDAVCFRHGSDAEGHPTLTMLLRSGVAWQQTYGGTLDGGLWRITVLDVPGEAYSYYDSLLGISGSHLWMDNMEVYGVIPGQSCFCLESLSCDDVPQTASGILSQWQEARTHLLTDGGVLDEYAFFQNPDLPTDEDFTVLPFPQGHDGPSAQRIGIGTQGDLGLGAPLSTRTSTRSVAAAGDYWLEETYDGLIATLYVEGASGTRTLTALDVTMPIETNSSRRNAGIGAPAYSAWLCYAGYDYGYPLPQDPLPADFFLDGPEGSDLPVNPRYADTPICFSITQTQGGVPLPCPYRLEFYCTDNSVTRVVMYADLLDGARPF